MPLYNLKIAFRYLIKNKIYTTLIIAGFSIGFAVFMLIMFFYFSEKKVNKGFAHHKEIYRLYDSKENRLDLRYDFAAVLQSNYTGIVSSCPMDYMDGKELIAKDENNNNGVMIRHMVSTTNSFTEVFSVKIVQSLSGKLFDGNEAMSISRSLAAKLFNSENVLGNTLEYGNTILKYKGKITSVFEDLPQNSTFKADVLLNSENKAFRFATGCDDEKCWNLTKMYVRLNPEAHPEELISNLNKIQNLDIYGIGKLDFQPLEDIYLSELSAKDTHLKGNLKLLILLLAIVLVVLFLSAINYVNYMITQQYLKFRSIAIILTCMGILSQVIVTSLIRTKEIGIRKVNGARSVEILAMLNSDFLKVIGIAFIITSPVAWYAIRYWLQNFSSKTTMNWWVFAAAGMVALVITLLTVSWQSWRTANMNPVEALRWE